MPDLPPRLQEFVQDAQSLDKMGRSLLLLDYADALPDDYPEALKDEAHRVKGCVSTVYLDAGLDETPEPAMRFRAWADGQIARGMVAVLVTGLDGLPPEEIAAVDPAFIRESGLAESLTAGRQGGFAAMLARMQAEAQRVLRDA